MSKEVTKKVEYYCDVCGRDLTEHNYLELRREYSIFRYWKNYNREGHKKNLQYDLCFDCIDRIGHEVAKSTKVETMEKSDE